MSQFGFRTSPNNQTSLSTRRSSLTPPPPPPTSSTTMAVTSSAPRLTTSTSSTGGGGGGSSASSPPISTTTAGGPPPGGLAPPPHHTGPPPPSGGSQRCCDTGRPIFTDPLTGQSVCSCQYELLGYHRLAAAAAGAGAGAPGGGLGMYGAPPGYEGMAAYFPSLGAADHQAAFYSPTGGALDLKENLAAGSWPYPSVYHPYDAAFAGYPFNGYGMDLNGARRKNATRETTSTLKAWLNEHKKNPYPTKGEKIMLAIITKMTLTQVSTWFANARRRLKKENKMTWEPRNRVEDEDNNNEDDDQKSTDGKDLLDSKDSGTASSEDGDNHRTTHHHPSHHLPHPRLHAPQPSGDGPNNTNNHPTDRGNDTGSEWSESRPDSGPDSPEPCPHPAFMTSGHLGGSTSPPPGGHILHHPHASSVVVSSKPRIWSLADMASKDNSTGSQQDHGQQFGGGSSAAGFYQLSAAAAAAAAVTGRLVPTAGRLPPPPPSTHNTAPYIRTQHDFYRSLYGPSAAAVQHLANSELLESYQRTLVAAHHKSPSTSSTLGLPLGLTTSQPGGGQSSRLSPSSTSSISSGSETPLKPIALNKA